MSVKAESALSILGVSGRAFDVHAWPASVRTGRPVTLSTQTWISEARTVTGYGAGCTMRVSIRFDDNCKNGHETFGITAEIHDKRRRDIAGGCLHDDIVKFFPELAPLLRWHLTSSDEPLHYVANTVYLAGDRDHNGLRKGEVRPVLNRDGLPRWELRAVTSGPHGLGVRISDTPTGREYHGMEHVPLFILTGTATGAEPPMTPVLQWMQATETGEGKARDLVAARSAANWPEATDEDLSADRDTLKAALLARLPALQAEFRRTMESIGFVWSVEG